MWGPPYSLPHFTGSSCLSTHNYTVSSQAGEDSIPRVFTLLFVMKNINKTMLRFSEINSCLNKFNWNHKYQNITFSTRSEVCGIMSVHNLNYQEWHPVLCNDSIVVDVICFNESYYLHQHVTHTILQNHSSLPLSRKFSCRNTHILYKGHCFQLSTQISMTKRQFLHVSKEFGAVMESLSLVNQVRILFAIFSFESTQFYEYNPHRKVIQLLKYRTPHNGELVIYLSKEPLLNSNFDASALALVVHQCDTGEYLSKKLVHNNVVDCPNGTDESDLPCFTNEKQRGNTTYCKTVCRRPKCTCDDLYYQKPQGGCFPYQRRTDELANNGKFQFLDKSLKYTSTQIAFVHSSQIVIEDIILPDETTKGNTNLSHFELYTDCAVPKLHKINQNIVLSNTGCTRKDEMQCTYGCNRCFTLSKLCVYELDHYGNLMHCPSGAHLISCEDMQCNNMFKCYLHYCIPYR